MSGPTWLPPKQPEPARASLRRPLPRGALELSPAHGAGKTTPCDGGSHPPAGFCLLPILPLPPLPRSWAGTSLLSPPCFLPHAHIPSAAGKGKRRPERGGLHKCHPSLLPHPHLHSLPSPQHSSPTPGSIFAPSHLSSVTRPQGDQRTGGRPGWVAMERPSARR